MASHTATRPAPAVACGTGNVLPRARMEQRRCCRGGGGAKLATLVLSTGAEVGLMIVAAADPWYYTNVFNIARASYPCVLALELLRVRLCAFVQHCSLALQGGCCWDRCIRSSPHCYANGISSKYSVCCSSWLFFGVHVACTASVCGLGCPQLCCRNKATGRVTGRHVQVIRVAEHGMAGWHVSSVCAP